jgi:AGZA family xanthine/uracil permease-like MFS transporter
VAVLIIDRKLDKAAYFAFAGATLTFFGLIHSEAIGVGKTPMVAASYAVCGLFLFICAKRATAFEQVQAHPPVIEHGLGEAA